MATATATPPPKTQERKRGFAARLRALGRSLPGQKDDCCQTTGLAGPTGLPLVAIVGNPNVGKSVTFNRLTGLYANVSNYPGTTVSVSRSKALLNGHEYEVVDTPGMYALMPITEEERVARAILLGEKPVLVVHVVDAKNLERMLPFTLQLIEAGLPVLLDLNLMDEAQQLGMQIDIGELSRRLGVTVVPTVATSGRGVEELKRRIDEHATRRCRNC
ncbi:MAG: FeoB small GTPase domain-containing protein [Chloroflexota bacterium]